MISVLVVIALGNGLTEEGRQVRTGEIIDKVVRNNGGERICSWVREVIGKKLIERNLLPANDRKEVMSHLKHCNYCKRWTATNKKGQTALIA